MKHFDCKQAQKEGWAIFEVHGSADPAPFHLERVDELEIFPDDTAAQRFVLKRAQNGSKYHRDALEWLREHSPEEYLRINFNSADPPAPKVSRAAPLAPAKGSRDDISVRLHVKASFSVTLGIYDGPITREAIAENIEDILMASGTIADAIDGWSIEEVTDQDGARQLIGAEQ